MQTMVMPPEVERVTCPQERSHADREGDSKKTFLLRSMLHAAGIARSRTQNFADLVKHKCDLIYYVSTAPC